MTTSLENLSGPGKPLRVESFDDREFQGLVASGKARLADALRAENSLSGRFDLAYNAAHALSLAALRRLGFRPENRFIVFQVLPHTLSLGPEVWRVLSKCHDLRNQAEYEGLLNVDERLVAELVVACRALAEKLDGLP